MPARIIDDRELWDRFIDRSLNGTLFHKWDFLDIQQKYTGYSNLRCGIFQGDTLVAVIPVFYTGGRGLKLVYSPPPTSMVYVPYQGIVVSREAEKLKQHEREQLWSFIAGQMDAEVRKLSPNYVTIGLTPGIGDMRPFIWSGYEVEVRNTYIVDLEKPLEAVWGSMEKECKRCIKIAAGYPLEIKRVYDANTFIDTMRKGLNRLGKTFFHRQGPEYIREVMQAFPENVKMYFLYHLNEVIGVAVMCQFNGNSILWMGNTVVGEGLSANDYMLWEMIKRAKEEGCRTFEHCGADEKRLNFAKTKLNPALRPYFYLLKKDALYRTAKYGTTKIEKAVGL